MIQIFLYRGNTTQHTMHICTMATRHIQSAPASIRVGLLWCPLLYHVSSTAWWYVEVELIRPHHWLVKATATLPQESLMTGAPSHLKERLKSTYQITFNQFVISFTKASVKHYSHTVQYFGLLKTWCCGGKVAVETATNGRPFYWLTRSNVRRVHCSLHITIRYANICRFCSV